MDPKKKDVEIAEIIDPQKLRPHAVSLQISPTVESSSAKSSWMSPSSTRSRSAFNQSMDKDGYPHSSSNSDLRSPSRAATDRVIVVKPKENDLKEYVLDDA